MNKQTTLIKTASSLLLIVSFSAHAKKDIKFFEPTGRDEVEHAIEDVQNMAETLRDNASNVGKNIETRTRNTGKNIETHVRNAGENIKNELKGYEEGVKQDLRPIEDDVINLENSVNDLRKEVESFANENQERLKDYFDEYDFKMLRLSDDSGLLIVSTDKELYLKLSFDDLSLTEISLTDEQLKKVKKAKGKLSLNNISNQVRDRLSAQKTELKEIERRAKKVLNKIVQKVDVASEDVIELN